MLFGKRTLTKVYILYCIVFTTMRSLLGQYFGSIPNLLFIGLNVMMIVSYFIRYKHMTSKIKINSFYLLYICFFVFYFINFLVCPESDSYSLFEYALYLLLLFSFFCVYESVDFAWIIKAYVYVCSLVAVEAIWEYSTGIIIYRVAYSGTQIIRRAFGLVGSPLTLGMLLACSSLMAIYCMLKYSKKYVILTILQIIGMFCTQSRGPIIAFIVGVITMYLVHGDLSDKNKLIGKIKRVVFLTIVIALLYAAMVYFSGHIVFVKTIYDRIFTALEFGTNNSNQERARRWAFAYSLFKQYPLFGYGVSSTGPHASTGIISESGVLKILAETGAIGFALYYGMLIVGMIGSSKKCIRQKVEEAPLAIGLMVAILAENFVLQILESVTIFQIFMLMLSFLLYSESKKIYIKDNY